MAGSSNTELRASVKLNTKDAVKSLTALEKRINKIQRAINNSGSSSGKFSKYIQNATGNMNKLGAATQRGVTAANKLTKSFKNSNSAVSVLTKNLRTMISTYVGIMGAKAVTNASDTITSTRNMLNNLPGGSDALTSQALDKTWAASQRSRGDYATMLNNVGKTMTLAGESFQNNVDNAIRFQEIMSKAYTVGGASAAEQSSSMYQLVQALGSGILQGDELRSVREGAPIAYKKIEEFAQGVLNTKDSLKELASQGVITSDVVVAAIMNAEDEIESAFNNTDVTFTQAFNNIKNTALKAFEPVLKKLNEFLNSSAGQSAVEGISNALVFLANTVLWLFDILGSFFSWCSDNWYWLQWVVYAVVTAMCIHLGILAAQAIVTGIKTFIAFLTGLSPLYLWIVLIGLVIGAIVYLTEVTGSACEAIYQVCLALAWAIIGVLAFVLAAYIITGTVILSIPTIIALAIVAILALLVAAFVMYTEQVMGSVYVAGAFIYNLVVGVLDGILQCVFFLIDPILGVIEFILNACNGGFNSFGDACANLLGQIISWFLSLGKVVTKIIDAIFGTDWTSGLNSLQDSVLAWGKNEKAITISRDAPTMASISGGSLPNRIAYGDAWSSGTAKGAEIHNSIEEFGNKMTDFSLGDTLSSLTDGFDSLTNTALGTSGSIPNAYDPALALGDSYDPSNALKQLGNIDGNTDSIADSMELTTEDLEYLRKIAEQEWKKEYTTAEIRVDMTNYNTINEEADLDGIFTKLSEELVEELNIGADGVYA